MWKELDKLGILSKVRSITTDNEAAVKSACFGLVEKCRWI
jgi:hypothetical protein